MGIISVFNNGYLMLLPILSARKKIFNEEIIMSEKKSLKDIIKPKKQEKSLATPEPAPKETLTKREAVRQKLEDLPKEPARTHVVEEGETLSHIALKYYGKATPPYYQHIYQHNLEVIGDNINIIVPGQELVIPDLPDELK